MKKRALSVVLTALALGAWTAPFPAASPAPIADPAADPAPPADVSVTGTVLDARTSRPLTGVQVYAPALKVGTLTDRRGRYALRFPDAHTGAEVTLRFELIGYTAVEKTVTPGDDPVVLDVQLTSGVLKLEEMFVTGVAGAPAPEAGRAANDLQRVRLPATAGTIQLRGATPADHRPRDLPGRYNPDFEREGYDAIADNPFLAVGPNPLSTFSVDVDRASYANVRRFLRSGTLPPPDAVRIEELVNYFGYRDAAPDADAEAPFRVTTEVAPAPWQPLHRLVRIALKAREVDLRDIPPSNLVFLVDVSGSMQSPDKLPLLKTALGMLVEELRPEDRVAVVVYAGAAGLVLESTPGSEKAAIHRALERLEAGGSTAGGAGIRLAYDVARRNHVEGGNNRIILATDGDFNIGASSDAAMVRLIEEKREQGTFLTVLGFGTGNLQDAKMEKIADHGNGNFAYIDSPLEARKVLVSEMGGTLLTVAKDVKLQVEFNPARVAGYRLIGYENRRLAAEDFDDDAKDAGEIGAGHSVVALYEVVPVGVEGTAELRGVDELRYRESPDARPGAAGSDELLYVKLRYKQPDGDRSTRFDQVVADRPVELAATTDDFRFSAAVAAWGMLLRRSEHCGGYTFEEVARLARSGLGEDEAGYRAEFLSLVGASATLSATEDPPRR